MANDDRSKAVKEGLKLTAMAAGGLAARTLWVTLRTIAIFVAVSALAYRILVVPKLQNYQKAMQSAADHELRSNTPVSTSPGKYRYHYDLSDEQKKKLMDAWPRNQLSRIYVVTPAEGGARPYGVSADRQKDVDAEGHAATDEFAQLLWDNSIDAAKVDEAVAPRYRNAGFVLVMNKPDDGSIAQWPPDVQVLLALFHAVNIPVSCCQRDSSIPEGSVGIAVGAK